MSVIYKTGESKRTVLNKTGWDKSRFISAHVCMPEIILFSLSLKEGENRRERQNIFSLLLVLIFISFSILSKTYLVFQMK